MSTKVKKSDLIESYNRTKELVDKLPNNEIKKKFESELDELKNKMARNERREKQIEPSAKEQMSEAKKSIKKTKRLYNSLNYREFIIDTILNIIGFLIIILTAAGGLWLIFALAKATIHEWR